MPARRPLWQCPSCGERFVTRNMSHSCVRRRLEDHFVGKDGAVWELFRALEGAIRGFGEVHVYAQKTRIVFQTRGRFVAVQPRKRHLSGHVWLKRPRPHPRVHRIESLLDRDFVHHFRLTGPGDIDEGFRELLHESYRVGSQEFSDPGDAPGS